MVDSADRRAQDRSAWTRENSGGGAILTLGRNYSFQIFAMGKLTL
jgi:hypothetical protein